MLLNICRPVFSNLDDVAMPWPLTRVKAMTTVTTFPYFLFVLSSKLPIKPPLPSPPSSSSPIPIPIPIPIPSVFTSSSVIMKNFRPHQVPTISPAVLSQSSVVQEPVGKRCLSREEWTDEKHSMYLKTMEASFVKQLHNSKQVLAWRYPKAATFSHSTPTTSIQWKDVGDGNWRKKGSVTSTGKVYTASAHHMSFFSDIEMTGQNFVDDDDEVVECESKNVKRLKPLISNTSMH